MAVRKKKYIGEKINIFHSPWMVDWYKEKVTGTKLEWTLDWVHLWNEVLYWIIIFIAGYFINRATDILSIDTDYIGLAIVAFLHKTLLKATLKT